MRSRLVELTSPKEDKVDVAGRNKQGVVVQQIGKGREGRRVTTLCRNGGGSGNGLLQLLTCGQFCEPLSPV
jgi:hypothetical protein